MNFIRLSFPSQKRNHPAYWAQAAAFFQCLLILLALAAAALAAAPEPPLRESAVVRAVRQVSPAVVNISSTTSSARRASPFGSQGGDPFFEYFFRDFFENPREGRAQRTSLGSGVIIDGRRGFILTNAHVIEQAGTINVVLQDEREFEAQIIGADPDSDLAVLRIRSDTPLPAVTMGHSDDLMIGETVIAIGNPFGFSHTVTTGVISALHRSFRADERAFHDFIQIDASINPGNSGGPLLNINGELIGVNTAIYARAQGIGFTIPIDKARRIVGDLIAHGEVITPWTGILVQDLDESMASYLNTAKRKGVLVREVMAGSPAAGAGVRSGDLITAIGSKALDSSDTYRQALRNYTAGNPIPLSLQRGGQALDFTLTGRAFPAERALELAEWLLGVRVGERPSRGSGAPAGVTITEVRQSSYLGRIGVRAGDIIRQLDGQAITGLSEFRTLIARYHDKASMVIVLQRGNQSYSIAVEL